MVVLTGFIALFLLLFCGLPIAFGLALVGFFGFAFYSGFGASLAMAGQVLFDTTLSYDLSVLPLFILMGAFITQSRMSDELYAASNAFLGHRRGGLAMATVSACGGFSAVCGSSLATVATMSKVALPQMKRYGYADGFAAASVAAGGTLGVLIPPSVILVLYGIMTQTDIGALFAAGLIPGLLGIGLYFLAIQWVTYRNPAAGPPGERIQWRDRWRALGAVWAVLLLFVLVLGGIYGGVFTPTEAAGMGAAGAFLIALARGTLTWKTFLAALVETARTSAMMFMVLIGAMLFANFVNIARFPFLLADLATGFDLSPLVIILVIMMIYILLGCVLESLSMMLLTVPIFFPLVVGLGFDPVWFGIFVVVVIEIGLISPPLGLNAFIIKGMAPHISLGNIFSGLIPFIGADIVRILLLLFFPTIALFLPRLFH
ncbi:MAG: TRAP transporter large permease [Aquisalimonadaceae bacterium]